MQRRSKIRHSYLSICESRCVTEETALSGDLLVVLSNAERRCLEIAKAQTSGFARSILFHFDPVNRAEERETNLNILRSHIERHSAHSRICALGSITDYRHVFGRVQDIFIVEREVFGRSIDITIDASCLPKHYLIHLIGFLLKYSLSHRIKLFYAETLYHSKSHFSSGANNEPVFSIGDWEAIVIPFFEGELVIESRSRLIAMLGFETLEASRFIHSYQADQYAVVMALADFNQPYADKAFEEGKTLARDFDIPDNMILSANAGSVVEVINIFDQNFKESDGRANVIVCLGPKPHAIGAAVHSIIHENYTVICRVPSAYPEFHTEPDGNAWVYEIEDLSSLYTTLPQ